MHSRRVGALNWVRSALAYLGFTNSGKGFGFLTFASEEAAQTCIETLNSTEIDGNIIKMNIARGKQGKEVSHY